MYKASKINADTGDGKEEEFDTIGQALHFIATYSLPEARNPCLWSITWNEGDRQYRLGDVGMGQQLVLNVEGHECSIEMDMP